MPELPEVETVRLGLEPLLCGIRIKTVQLRRAGLRAPFAPGFCQALTGAQITALRRRAKYILADLDTGQTLLVHLGMTGSFRSVEKGAVFTAEAHDHVVFTLQDGLRLAYNDPRRFGQMALYDTAREAAHPALGALGPEPLDQGFSGRVLAARLAGRKGPIKPALLDQRVVAGVGNIYACEALFRAGVDPRRAAGALTGAEYTRLATAIRAVLAAALKSGGSTLRNYRQVDGNTGFFQHKFDVYDRAGVFCTCGLPPKKHMVEQLQQAGRTTFFCPVKQQ